jgi:hypothetical protein
MTPEWRVPLVPDCRISIILATFDPDLLAIVVFGDNECAISARGPPEMSRRRGNDSCFVSSNSPAPASQSGLHRVTY